MLRIRLARRTNAARAIALSPIARNLPSPRANNRPLQDLPAGAQADAHDRRFHQPQWERPRAGEEFRQDRPQEALSGVQNTRKTAQKHASEAPFGRVYAKFS